MMSAPEYRELMAEEASAQKRADAREAHLENLYGWICRQGCQESAVASLEDYALRDLIGWLSRLNEPHGVPGEILGRVLVEAARRYVAQGERKTL